MPRMTVVDGLAESLNRLHVSFGPVALVARPSVFLSLIHIWIYQAARRNTVGDYTATGVAFVLYAMPSFLLCMLLLDAFSRCV